jgi:hypothetical protein
MMAGDPASVQSLIDMGFDADKSRMALKVSNIDLRPRQHIFRLQLASRY